MMTFRVLLLAALLLIPGALRAKPLADMAGVSPRLVIYLAKGAPNACGQGCDRWIAVEGKVDLAAAARVSRFLRNVKDTQRPIYLHSPGGSVEQAFIIGRLLRSRKAVARVGRTIVAACGAEQQADDACLKIKTSGGEVEAAIETRHSMCNSACGYLFLGATTREVAPDAAMAVHNSKLTLVIHGHPSPGQVAEFTDNSLTKADRERASYIVAMGFGREFDDLITTIKFDNARALTRSEIFRFGIDARPFVETSWILETEARPYARKIALAKKQDDTSFRLMEWRLFCENKDHARLMFIREFDKAAAGVNAVMMTAGAEKPVRFGSYPARIGSYEAWSGTMTSDAMKMVLAVPHLQMAEATLVSGGKVNQEIFDIDTSGLEPAWTQLVASCPASPGNLKPVASPVVTSAPAQ